MAHSFPAHRGRGRRRRIDFHPRFSFPEHREGGPSVKKSEGFVFLSRAESLPFLYRTCFSVLIDGAGMPCGWRRLPAASRAYRGSGDARLSCKMRFRSRRLSQAHGFGREGRWCGTFFPRTSRERAPPADRFASPLIFCRIPRGRAFREKPEGFVFLSRAEPLLFLYRICSSVSIVGARGCSADGVVHQQRVVPIAGAGTPRTREERGGSLHGIFLADLPWRAGKNASAKFSVELWQSARQGAGGKDVLPQRISLPGDTTCRGGRERTPCKAVRQRAVAAGENIAPSAPPRRPFEAKTAVAA